LNRIHFPEVDIIKLNADVSSWMKSGISASDFEAQIGADFYILAYQICYKLVNKKFMKNVPDIVTDVMGDFIGKLRDGVIPFQAKSKFSTYLYGVVNNKVRSKFKIEYPTEIKRLGSAALYLYDLVLIKDYEYKLAVDECFQMFNINRTQLKEWLPVIEKYRDRSNDHKVSRGQVPLEYSYSHCGESDESTDFWEPSYIDDIPGKLEDKEITNQLNHALNLLNDSEYAVIVGYYLDGKSFNQLKKENPHIKNIQYEVRKGEKSLRSFMNIQE